MENKVDSRAQYSRDPFEFERFPLIANLSRAEAME